MGTAVIVLYFIGRVAVSIKPVRMGEADPGESILTSFEDAMEWAYEDRFELVPGYFLSFPFDRPTWMMICGLIVRVLPLLVVGRAGSRLSV